MFRCFRFFLPTFPFSFFLWRVHAKEIRLRSCELSERTQERSRNDRFSSSRFSLLRLSRAGGKKKESSKIEHVFCESRLYHKVAASFTNGLRVATPLFIPLFVLFIPISYVFLSFRFVFADFSPRRKASRNALFRSPRCLSNFHATLIRTRERGTKGERLIPPRLDHTFSSPFSLAYSVTNRSRRSIWSTGHLATGNVITLFFRDFFFTFVCFSFN